MEESKEHEKKAHEPAPEPINWENIAKYKAAELENYIKRNRDSVQNAFNDGRQNVIMGILPFGDALAEALRTVKDESATGIQILIRKFESFLRDLGLEEISVKHGDPFDPYVHSCIGESGTGENKVIDVLQKGYKFAGRVIRPAMVKI